MAASYFLTRQALIDLEILHDFIAEKSPQSAARLIQLIEKKCKKIVLTPAMGKNRSELATDLRSLPVGKYIIFYRQNGKNIEIIRVLHGARDIPSQFS